jgi:hypothetical protein
MSRKILTSLDLNSDILIKGVANTTAGYVLTSNGAGSVSWAAASGGGSFTGGTLTSNLKLTANSASVSPLTFQSGTILTTPLAGSHEYDGTVFYATPNVSTATTGSTVTGRGLIPANELYYLNADSATTTIPTNNSGTSPVLNKKSFWLAANTVYEIDMQVVCKIVTTGTTVGSNIFDVVLPTGATCLLFIDYQPNITTLVSTTAETTNNYVVIQAATTGQNLVALTGSATRYHKIKVKGTVKTSTTAGYHSFNYGVNITSGGTSGVYNVLAGSFGKATAIGAAGADINIGPLS